MREGSGGYSPLNFLCCSLKVDVNLITHIVHYKAITKTNLIQRIINIACQKRGNTKAKVVYSRDARRGGTGEQRTNGLNINKHPHGKLKSTDTNH